MANNICNFTIPSGSTNGSRLTGNGFNGRPQLATSDTIQVIVRYAGPNPPGTLNGYFVITPAPDAQNQTTPSPFVNGSKFVCHAVFGVSQDAGGPTYTFPLFTYLGGLPGAYELTFVAEDATVTPATQWSEDPEFDTGN